MRYVKRLAVVVATVTAGLVLGGTGTASAVGANVQGVGYAYSCPPGYYGVTAGTDLTGGAYVCQNIF